MTHCCSSFATCLLASALFTLPAFAQGDPATRVDDIFPGAESGLFTLGPCFPTAGEPEPGFFITSLGETLLFSADDGFHGAELWSSNRDWQTSLVRDVATGPDSAFSEFCFFSPGLVVGDLLFFSAWTEAHHIELWASDGSGDGTYLVKDIRPGGNSSPGGLTEFDGRLAFRANDGVNGNELWISDGTEVGTTRISDLDTGTYSAGPLRMTVSGDLLFFNAADGVDRVLWRTDGTPEGTARVLETGELEDPDSLTDFQGTLFFVVTPPAAPAELWRTDGSVAGTAIVATFASGAPFSLTAAGDSLYFLAEDSSGETHLWKTDGTPEGTLDIIGADVIFGLFATMDGRLLGAGSADGTGFELWHSDGTPEGTGILKDLRPGVSGSFPSRFAELDGRVYFSANDGVHGREPWSTDGSPEGTMMVQDIHPGPGDSYPAVFTAFSDTLFFGADDGVHGRELWALGEPPSVVAIPALGKTGLAALALAIGLGALAVLRRRPAPR